VEYRLCTELRGHQRCGYDDFCINQLLLKNRVGSLLVRSGDKLIVVLLNPLPQAELILHRAQEFGDLLCMFPALKRGKKFITLLFTRALWQLND